MKTCYVYKWTHLPSLKWYIGSRTCKKAHPDDGYICSSNIVKPLILENPNHWQRTIISIGTAEEMRELETQILTLFDAKNDSQSFNQHNNDGTFFNRGGKKQSSEHVEKRISKQIGKKRPGIGGNKKGVTTWNKGKKLPFKSKTKEHAMAISKALIGKKKSIEAIENNRQAQINLPMLTCVYCGQNIKNPGNLKQHIKAKHQEFKI